MKTLKNLLYGVSSVLILIPNSTPILPTNTDITYDLRAYQQDVYEVAANWRNQAARRYWRNQATRR